MRIRKCLILPIVAAVVSLSAFSSPALAADGVLRDVNSGNPIANGSTLHFFGWFAFGGEGFKIQCHITVTAEATNSGTALNIKQFNIDTNNCSGDGVLTGCRITADTVFGLPYSTTITATDFDVLNELSIGFVLSNCSIFPFTGAAIIAENGVTLKPFLTGARTATNTSGNLGQTATTGEPIAGVELEAEAEVFLEPSGFASAAITGELELTSPERCTYKLSAS